MYLLSSVAKVADMSKGGGFMIFLQSGFLKHFYGVDRCARESLLQLNLRCNRICSKNAFLAIKTIDLNTAATVFCSISKL